MIYRIIIIFLLIINAPKIIAQFGPDIDQSVKLTADVDSEDTSITINWIVDERATGFDLYKRKYGEQSWSSKIGQFNTDTNSFSDFDILPNTLYEYKIQKYTEEDVDGFGYILSGIAIDPSHVEGKAILVLTETTYQNVESQISKFQDILSLDGWPNRLLIVPDEYIVEDVKNLLVGEYQSDPFTTCLLLGDVPIALSGNVSPDGHETQGGAWAADLYYGDMDGEWTDTITSTIISPWPVNHNIPGDGKWDQSIIPSDIEVAIGRIDFSNLPVFEKDEYELLSDYIEKNIAYRTKEMEVRKRAAIYNINPWIGALGQNGVRNFSTIVSPDSILYDDFEPLWNESYMWLYAASSGFHDILFMVTTSTELAKRPLRAVFTNFFGSRFGNYDYTNNIMRTALGSGDVLSSCWVGAPHWHFHSMAMGFSLGHATIATQNNDTIYTADHNVKGIHVNLLGDPTLGLYPMEKIESIEATENQLFIDLSWTPTSDAQGYFIYRKSIEDSDFEILNSIPVPNTTYRDSCQSPNQTFAYMVRATRLELTPSGTYYNLSIGAMDTVITTIDNIPQASFDFSIQNDIVFLTDQSSNADSIIILGVEEVIDQNDGTYLLIDIDDGDTITLIAKNACGSDTTSQEIVINSIEDYDQNNISVFPNPSSSTIQITSDEPILKWKLRRSDGSLIKSQETNSKQVMIDVSTISVGVYNLLISTKKTDILRRIIVE